MDYGFDQLEPSFSVEESLIASGEDIQSLCYTYLGNAAASGGGDYTNMDVDYWQGEECVEWAKSVLDRHGIDESQVDLFSLRNNTGSSLRQYSCQDFCTLVSDQHGPLLHQEFRKYIRRYSNEPEASGSFDTEFGASEHYQYLAPSMDSYAQGYDEESDPEDDEFPVDQMRNMNFEERSSADVACSSGEALQLSSQPQPAAQSHEALQKIPSTKRNRVRGPKNYEFLIRLLVDKRTNPTLIRWEDKSTATFRLVQPDIIAKIWSSRSSDPQPMTYNNFARGLRYHYKKGTLQPVSEKQLVYRCGPKALKYLSDLTRGSS